MFVWGINRIYLAKDLGLNIDYYIALDKHLWQQEGIKLASLNAKKYFVPERYVNVAKEKIHHWKIETFKYGSNPTNFDTEFIGHGYTTVVAATQLAVKEGATEIQYYGVDWTKDKHDSGKSHFYGNAQRSDKFWELGKKNFIQVLKWLDSLNVRYQVNSDLFMLDGSEKEINETIEKVEQCKIKCG